MAIYKPIGLWSCFGTAMNRQWNHLLEIEQHQLSNVNSEMPIHSEPRARTGGCFTKINNEKNVKKNDFSLSTLLNVDPKCIECRSRRRKYKSTMVQINCWKNVLSGKPESWKQLVSWLNIWSLACSYSPFTVTSQFWLRKPPNERKIKFKNLSQTLGKFQISNS